MKRRILLVEDDAPKQAQILKVLIDLDVELIIANSINEATCKLDDYEFDCVLLDMSLPTFKEGLSISSSGRQQDFGGRQILTYMWELQINSRVMIVTQLPGFINEQGEEVSLSQLDDALTRDFPGLYAGYTRFHHSTDAWEVKLKEFLNQND